MSADGTGIFQLTDHPGIDIVPHFHLMVQKSSIRASMPGELRNFHHECRWFEPKAGYEQLWKR